MESDLRGQNFANSLYFSLLAPNSSERSSLWTPLSAMLFVISKLQIVIPTLIPRMRVRIPSVNLPMRRPKPENEGKLGP